MTDQPHELIDLDRRECVRLLLAHEVGRIAVTVDGQPHIMPVTYAADTSGDVVFRTGPDTMLTRVDLARVAFEIDGVDVKARSGWSVSVHGSGREITDDDDQTARYLRQKLGLSWAPGPRTRWFVIAPQEVTGRRLRMATDNDETRPPGVPWT
jgi:nitroimidazol reductase NimA-like FMN-containing flavoprotein (pyridoxamine 5'-phosphate oxidase superfamily)